MENKQVTIHKKINRQELLEGMTAGIPIGMGYLAVAFSLGIVARNAGLTPVQGFLASLLNNTSAGEYVGFRLIADQAPYLEVALLTLITNARYFLMSCALSQNLDPDTSLLQRLLISYAVTDEIFDISVVRPKYLNPYYAYGAVLVAAPCWAFGTMLGIISGELLPVRIANALGVALYGMFLAVIIPPARKSKVILGVVSCSFIASYLATKLPWFSSLSEGVRIIILTVSISTVAALLFPRKQIQGGGKHA